MQKAYNYMRSKPKSIDNDYFDSYPLINDIFNWLGDGFLCAAEPLIFGVTAVQIVSLATLNMCNIFQFIAFL